MPASEKILQLIKYIVCYATDHDIKLTTVRLVKYVYLADLYHARWFQGKTYTDLPWMFKNFGPYCQEVMSSIDKAIAGGLIDPEKYESKYGPKDYTLFTCHDEKYYQFRKSIPMAIIGELESVIKKYGDDTAQLLDYVYFDTEPMIEARKGDMLDFSKAQRPQTIKLNESKAMTKNEIKQAREHVVKLKDKYLAAREKLLRDEMKIEKWKDDAYFATLNLWDEEVSLIGLKGIARIED